MRAGEAVGRRTRLWWLGCCLFLLLIETGIALFVRDRFVRSYLGDLLAVWAVYALARVFCPLAPVRGLPVFVFVFAAAVELSQLFGLAARLGLPAGSPLAVLLGGTFDAADLLCYAAGCASLLALERVERRLRGRVRR